MTVIPQSCPAHAPRLVATSVDRLHERGTLSLDSLPHRLDVAHGANLDAAGAGPGKLHRDLNRLVHVFRFDQIEASQDFLGFTKRPIHDPRATVADSDRLRC